MIYEVKDFKGHTLKIEKIGLYGIKNVFIISFNKYIIYNNKYEASKFYFRY